VQEAELVPLHEEALLELVEVDAVVVLVLDPPRSVGDFGGVHVLADVVPLPEAEGLAGYDLVDFHLLLLCRRGSVRME